MSVSKINSMYKDMIRLQRLSELLELRKHDADLNDIIDAELIAAGFDLGQFQANKQFILTNRILEEYDNADNIKASRSA